MPIATREFSNAASLVLNAWTSPSEALVEDTVFATNPTGAAIHGELHLYGWTGDTVPVGATIEGFRFTIRAKKTNPIFLAETSYGFRVGSGQAFQAVLGITGQDRYTTGFLFHATSTLIAGGPTDMFGLGSVTVGTVNHADFGVNIWRPTEDDDEIPQDLTENFFIDGVTAEIFYSNAGSGGALAALNGAQTRYIPGYGLRDADIKIIRGG